MNPADDNPPNEPGVHSDLNQDLVRETEGSPGEAELRKDGWQVAIVEGHSCDVADRLVGAIDMVAPDKSETETARQRLERELKRLGVTEDRFLDWYGDTKIDRQKLDSNWSRLTTNADK